MSADGSGLTQVNSAPGNECHPGWSPDGTELSFNSSRDSGSVFVINPDGSGEKQLAGNLATSSDPLLPAPWVPGWSSDGTNIVYVSDRNKTWTFGS